ncbi:MAG: disulfide bond formation protein B [Actinobacteria bacterium]|nr:disulfide bond formation protein B [Actinomycetota bacterium]
MTGSVITFTALLALLTNVASVAVVAALVAGRGRHWAASLLSAAGSEAIRLGALVAGVATAGSLYFSEVEHFVPCELCWYQRILMYPLAVILVVRGDRGVRPYALTLAVIGLPISLYHNLIEHVPRLAAEGACDLAAPCTAPWFWKFGFITLAYEAGSAFLFVGLLMIALGRPAPLESHE